MEEAIMKTLTYDHSRADLLPMGFLSLILFSLSVYLLYLGLYSDFTLFFLGQVTSLITALCGGLGVMFCGYTFSYILYRLVDPKDVLIINDRGIINQTNVLGSKAIIPFEIMKVAKIDKVHGKLYIGINLYNEAEYLENLPVFKRILQETNRKNFGMSLISVSAPTDSKEDLHQIVKIINERIEITKVRKEMNW